MNNVINTPCRGNLKEQDEPLKVMYGGIGRMGSSSLKFALERLGYSVLHGVDLHNHHIIIETLVKDMWGGNMTDLLQLTRYHGYNATGEFHSILFREIIKVEPNVKIIVPQRDFESWYPSFVVWLTAFRATFRFPLNYVPNMQLFHQGFLDYVSVIAQDRERGRVILEDPTTDLAKEYLRDAYYAHFGDLQELVPQSQRLNFSFSDGYPALCKFLDVTEQDCPKEKYPHSNIRSELHGATGLFLFLEACCYLLMILVPYKVFSFLGYRWGDIVYRIEKMTNQNTRTCTEEKKKE